MRRYQKKRIKDKFQYLHNGHQLIAELLVSNQDISSMLAECQSVAIGIGNEIEKYEGNGTQAVTFLEQYCELLYEFSEKKLTTRQVQAALSVKKRLDEKVSSAERSLEQDITEQIEVVFFPYKASMWDSMETVWRKYRNDNHAKCIVVPLPYYIKDRNRKKIKKCYEGTEFPAEVEITDYEQYLREKHYSDLAIYHNPYDNTNTITEVDSRFFTSEFHKYADTIVYIPYYVLIDKPSAAFILAPGVKNADYVILQDDETAQEFAKWYPNQQEKFLPLGSPKIDKAIQMNEMSKEELDIPQEWKDRIRGKKVLFYNTHLINFMDKNRDFIGKLKSVFETIQSQNEVVLWWRPHPLSEEMEYSTDSEKFGEYEKLVEWYQKEDIGIYDDSPNLHEAIAASDAYYGDGSSLVKLFQAVGKPVMIQNFMKINPESIFGSTKVKFDTNLYEWIHESAQFHLEMLADACIVENCLWCISNYNELFCIDLKDNKQKYFTIIKECDNENKILYSKIIHYNNKLILVPFNATRIAIFDLNKFLFEFFKLDIDCNQKFYAAEIYHDKIFFVPAQAKEVICFSLKKNNLEIMNGGKESFSKYEQSDWLWTAMTSCMLNDKIYFVIANTNILCEYNVKTSQINTIVLSDETITFSAVIAIHNGIFVIGFNRPYAVFLKPQTGEKKEFFFDSLYLWEESGIIGMLNIWNDRVYFTPSFGKKSISFDVQTGMVALEECFDWLQDGVYGFAKVLNNKLCLLPLLHQKSLYVSDGRILDINNAKNTIKIFGELMKENFIYEDGFTNLNLYLDYCSKNES